MDGQQNEPVPAPVVKTERTFRPQSERDLLDD